MHEINYYTVILLFKGAGGGGVQWVKKNVCFDVFQIPYSAFSQENETQITDASKAGMGTIIRGGVAKGQPGEGKGTPDRWALWEKAGLGDLCQEGETPTTFMWLCGAPVWISGSRTEMSAPSTRSPIFKDVT